jgi:hypothetical protein
MPLAAGGCAGLCYAMLCWAVLCDLLSVWSRLPGSKAGLR